MQKGCVALTLHLILGVPNLWPEDNFWHTTPRVWPIIIKLFNYTPWIFFYVANLRKVDVVLHCNDGGRGGPSSFEFETPALYRSNWVCSDFSFLFFRICVLAPCR